MLTHLQLRDLVIVDTAELDFGPGLTALTGETGAGKSIVVDALLLIAGGRGGGDIVRQGAERAEVAASFAGLPAAAKAWLEAQAIEHDEEVIVRRVIGVDGRSSLRSSSSKSTASKSFSTWSSAAPSGKCSTNISTNPTLPLQWPRSLPPRAPAVATTIRLRSPPTIASRASIFCATN
jgi:energy-coupling factor transporter ATP-binding protein EcfA2